MANEQVHLYNKKCLWVYGCRVTTLFYFETHTYSVDSLTKSLSQHLPRPYKYHKIHVCLARGGQFHMAMWQEHDTPHQHIARKQPVKKDSDRKLHLRPPLYF